MQHFILQKQQKKKKTIPQHNLCSPIFFSMLFRPQKINYKQLIEKVCMLERNGKKTMLYMLQH